AYLALTAGRRLQIPAITAVAFVLTISPWLAFNARHHGKLWVSDNAPVATSATRSNAQWYRHPRETVFNAPLLWLKRVARSTVRFALEIASILASAPLAAAALGLALAVLALSPLRESLKDPFVLRALSLTVVALAGLGGQVLIGYFDTRYFSFFVLWSCVAALTVLIRIAPTIVLPIGLIGLLIAGTLFGYLAVLRSYADARRDEVLARFPEVPKDARVLSDWDCYEFGARTRITSICLPLDWYELDEETREAFLNEFRPTIFMRRREDSIPLPNQLRATSKDTIATPPLALETMPLDSWRSETDGQDRPPKR
ncbi:MAG TPA: hypothetical protein VE621_07650, partial [Bryobacteraceae bacterium]|nr:hypothetical protein [Bryobacteraceae bacterium]